jgi:D-alanyl-lipoteichoic acid acyltransferase DltB (MBOAT superfamily)
MLFNSIQFLIFFPVIATIYFLLPHRYRWLLLLVGSYYFYMSWKPEYIILILASTLIDYSVGLKLGSESRPAIRRRWLLLSLVTNLGLLFSFKYFNFFNDSFRQLFQMANLSYPVPALNVLLPVGISFYTFQTLSYTIDVYRGKIQPERHLGVFALFVSFFPQLVAGPIERSGNLLPQFYQKTAVDYERIISGLQRMTWGFFKKVVIADRLALLVNTVYNHPTEFSGMPLIIATYAFGFQIYCDFSAYSDIAIGAARVMGFDLMENFRQPYYARSIPEFWRRWHISLSTWFRDYVYLPLGGNRVKLPHWVFNILVVFVVSGLWHGANWTFVIWGALHGIFMVGTFLGQLVWANIGKPV